jgi:uncharacterized protein YdaT
MHWNCNNYPRSMRNLDVHVRETAIEIVNTLLDEGYEESRAIPIAIAEARMWANSYIDNFKDNAAHLHVVPHPEGWAVRWANARKASFIFHSRSEAKNRALEIGMEKHAHVFIHHANGQIEGSFIS